MSIEAIRLRNFRGFADSEIQLKPLTVLLGPNSAGKSSFGHALAAMAHAHRIYGRTLEASLTPDPEDRDKWPIDLGNTIDLRTNGSEGLVQIGLNMRGEWIEYGFGLEPVKPDLRLSYISYPEGEGDEVSLPKPERTEVDDVEKIPRAQVDVDITNTKASILQTKTRRVEVRRINLAQWQDGTSPVFVPMDGLVPKEVRHESGTARVLSGRVRDELAFLLNHLTYLRPTRKRPSRTYGDDVDKRQAIGYAGEWTASILNKAGIDVVYVKPSKIPNTVDEARACLDAPWTEVRLPLGSAVDEWLRLMQLASAVRSVHLGGNQIELQVTQQDGQQHNITEVGFGVSQILPVLVAGLTQPEGSLFVVDLPEAHLHPRPQADLADFFCSLALSGRAALVETHSEMFFHRLRLRAEMHSKLMDRIAVYFIDPPKDGLCEKPRKVGLHFDDELRWPTGFLQEAWETEAQISAVREARRSPLQ